MNIVLPAKFEKLPQWQIRMAILHAQSHVEDVLGLKESDAGYFPKLQKEAIHFLEEGIEESLTPHMSNPTSPIAKDAFLKQPFFSIEGTFFTEHTKSQEQKEKYYRLLRSSINTLALIYTESAMHIGKSEYAFQKGEKPGGMGKVRNLNRFNRLFVVTAIMSLLEPLFRTNPKTLKAFIDAKVAEHGDELMRSEFREQFIKSIRKQITTEGFNAESLKKIL